MLEKLLDEIEDLREAKDLLDTILVECGGYGYSLPGMKPETLTRVQRFMKFDDSE
jgi:hypothetical protein